MRRTLTALIVICALTACEWVPDANQGEMLDYCGGLEQRANDALESDRYDEFVQLADEFSDICTENDISPDDVG